MNLEAIEKYNKVLVIKDDNNEFIATGLICPYSVHGDSCGSWCPHFKINVIQTACYDYKTQKNEIVSESIFLSLCHGSTIDSTRLEISEELKKEWGIK